MKKYFIVTYVAIPENAILLNGMIDITTTEAYLNKAEVIDLIAEDIAKYKAKYPVVTSIVELSKTEFDIWTRPKE